MAGKLRALWPRLIPVGIDLLAQELIPGPETRIESHHVYIDADGAVAGEFTGRKVRTYPVDYGHSTALTITDIDGEGADVAALGREIAARIGLDYFTIDCAETKDGSLLIFEADNTAVVHNMDPPDVFPYKSPQMHKIFGAFAAMLERRAAQGRERAA